MADVLPPAPWTQREDLKRLIAALGPETTRYVGGAVRDTLLGIEVKDIDLATRIEPRKVMRLLENAGIRAIPTGIDHGTVTALLAGGPVEITTLRHDVTTDGRRATVAFAKDWRDDAARRDFTINALYADPASGALFDFFGGLGDLAARRVRFIGDAEERIREDHLRILRYFRFQARFGSQPADEEAENSCSKLAGTLKALSRERIGMETLNLLALTDPAPTVVRMAELGVLEMILPEADPVALAALVAEERRQDIAPDSLRRLAALLPADPDLAAQVAARFRLSGTQKKRLVAAAGRNQTSLPPRALAYRLGLNQALDRLLIAGADCALLKDWAIPRFPLKGGDLVERGIKAGPQITRILREVEACWVAEGFPQAERAYELLAEHLPDANDGTG